MTQSLDVKIIIPEDYLLVKKVDWEEKLMRDLSGQQWEMKDLVERTRRSPAWIKENILYPYRNELKGFVKYPDKQGVPWRFGAVKMATWLDENLDKVL